MAHLGETRSFPAEQISQVGATLGGPIAEPVNPTFHDKGFPKFRLVSEWSVTWEEKSK
jgi:hypothetical protein